MSLPSKTCPHCGTTATPGSSYCLACGRPLVAAPGGSLFRRLRQDSAASLEQRKRDLGLAPAPRPQPPAARPLLDVLAADLEVQLENLPFVSYALQHVGIGSIRRLRIRNGGREPCQNLVIEIGLAPGDFGDNWTSNIPALAPGEHWEQENIRLPLYRDRLRSVLEKEQAFLKVRVADRRETLWSRTLDFGVLAYNEWLFVPEFMQLLAAFVQPNAPALFPVIQAAAARLQRDSGSAGFSGYQVGGPERVARMLQAIHDTLAQDFRIAYINPPPSFEGTGQKIRLVADTLSQRRGTCLDLAVLQAALWEHVGLHPLILVIPGHAFLACWLGPRQASAPVVELSQRTDGAGELVQALGDGVLVPFNSTEITAGASLQAAAEKGAALIAQTLEQPDAFLFMIDLAVSHRVITPLP